ncbi:MAG: nucleotidyltransferase domain-containing protein [Desulfurococcales archaeon]|nr:nucleotidyltransferase domain-containing protein [Desulfurococcales archaeon]
MVKAGVDREVLDLIRQIILEEASRLGIGVERIILFGSRARGDAREDSDWDILVVVRGEVERRLRRELSRRVRWRAVELLKAPVDVVVASEERWRSYQDAVGHLYYAVKREGVMV